MSDLVPASEVEQIVGAKRHPTWHLARAVSAEQRVYILHSRACLDSGIDLRTCAYSLALDDNGIEPSEFPEDVPLLLRNLDHRFPLIEAERVLNSDGGA